MKKRLFTPGPTPVPEETLLELARPVTYHRTPEARAVLAELTADLQYVFQTKNQVLTLTSSGTGGMDAAVSSSLAAGDKAILLTAGRWGERWLGILNAYQANVVTVRTDYGKAVTPGMLADALRQHPDAKLVLATLCETSTGVGHDIAAFGKQVAATPALFAVDAISGLGAMECRTDEWRIDLCVTGSQKALMMPPGLAFVAVSDKAWAAIDAAPVRNFYLDLRRYRKALAGSDSPFTPANTLIKAQAASLKRIRAEGIEAVWRRHERMAAACRAAAAALGLRVFAERPASALTVIEVPAGVDGTAVLKTLEREHGYKLADGQDALKGKIWRLSHMGYMDACDVIGAIAALEHVLPGFGLKFEPGAGVAAFQRSMMHGPDAE